jgi:hypothetical protein
MKIWAEFKREIIKEKTYFLTRVLPIGLGIYLGYYVYVNNVYNYFREFPLSSEKKIGKIISPLIKYKNIEMLYKENHPLYKRIKKLLNKISNIKELDLGNLSSNIFLIKSDLLFLHVLPNGDIYTSDVFLFIKKEFCLFL